MTPHLTQQAEKYLHRLCIEIPTRRVGCAGNRAATDFAAQLVASFGWQTERPAFDCIDWEQTGARLTGNDEAFHTFVSPYSLGCRVRAPLVAVSSIDELELIDARDKILLMHGDIAKEQLMPKNFVFYNPDEHKRIVALLEAKQPRAIIAATTRNPELAGGMYPFPLIEDGDFDIPSVYMTEDEGNRLAQHLGKEIALEIRARRIPSTGCNVIARKNANAEKRIVLTAHIDAKDGSPGAIDDGAGIVILLLVAELLREYRGKLGIELAMLNGEDHYSAAGEMLYLTSNRDKMDQVVLCINFDGVGYREGNTAYSLYDCPDKIANVIHQTLARQDGIVAGEQWYQGDHMIFVQNQVPALAFTSERAIELFMHITHTPKDAPEIIDCAKLAEVTMAIRELLFELDNVIQ